MGRRANDLKQLEKINSSFIKNVDGPSEQMECCSIGLWAEVDI